MDKKELRSQMRLMKRHFTQQELCGMALPINDAILDHPRVRNAKIVLAYHSLPDEVDMTRVLSALLSMEKRVLLPRIISNSEMTIHDYTGEQDLVAEEKFGIMEPCCTPFSDYGAIDVALIPGMAFDNQCHRLGRGKGYYDRFLSQCPDMYKIGVCFPFQLVDSVPFGEYDILMDEVVS